MISSVWHNEPTYWYDRQDLPSIDDPQFKTVEDWQAAMDAWQKANQGTPMYAPDSSVDYQRPDGSTGQWYTAGISENSPSFGLSEAAIAANTLNRKFMEMIQNPDAPGPGLGLALSSMLSQRPEMIQQAYEAVDKNGEPLLAPEVVAYLERLGVRPSAGLLQPPVDPNAPKPWSQQRLGVWDQTYLTDLAADLANGYGANIYNPELVDNMQRFKEQGQFSQDEFLTHIAQVLADNGFTLNDDGSISPTENPNHFTRDVPPQGFTEQPQPTPTPIPGAPPGTSPLMANEMSANGGPQTPTITPGANNAKVVQQLAQQYQNSGTGDYPEWMQIAMANRGKVGGPMTPAGVLGF